MADKLTRKVEVSYEGMGTNIEATIKVGGKMICVISALHPQQNKLTDEIVVLAKNHLIKKERERCLKPK